MTNLQNRRKLEERESPAELGAFKPFREASSATDGRSIAPSLPALFSSPVL